MTRHGTAGDGDASYSDGRLGKHVVVAFKNGKVADALHETRRTERPCIAYSNSVLHFVSWTGQESRRKSLTVCY